MTNEITTAYEPIDLCACFDMIFDPPAAVIKKWEKNGRNDLSQTRNEVITAPSLTVRFTTTTATPAPR